MIHHPEPVADDRCQDIEDANWQACYETAYLCGYSPADAENCDNGCRDCPECPFRIRREKYEQI